MTTRYVKSKNELTDGTPCPTPNVFGPISFVNTRARKIARPLCMTNGKLVHIKVRSTGIRKTCDVSVSKT